jgi:hypothetical protein
MVDERDVFMGIERRGLAMRTAWEEEESPCLGSVLLLFVGELHHIQS